jgi:cell division protein FtsI/penicillin-binding protein 2
VTSYTQSFKGRSVMIMIIFALSMSSLIVQLVRVQFGPFAPVFSSQTTQGLGPLEKRFPKRGLIYDRNGRLLATNNSLYYLDVERLQLTDESRKDIPLVISELLLLDRDDLEQQLGSNDDESDLLRIRLTQPTPDGGIIPIRIDKVAADIMEQFIEDPYGPDLMGLALEPVQERIYPARELTGHILGIVNQEGKGYFGVEGFYDEWLSGEPVDVQEAWIPFEAGSQPDPVAGVNLVLTIDLNIQQSVATILQGAIDSSGAESGQVIIMDPRNGEILAMVAWPPLDPEDYEAWLTEGEEENPIVSPSVAGQYEPGSTFKTLVMAAALDEGVVSPEDEFIDTGEIEVGGHIIRNWDGEEWGPQTMVGFLQYSLNTCLAFVGSQKLGASLLYSKLEDFGIGSLTGIDLAGEVPGKLRKPGDPLWTESDIGTNSFGQGVSVTPIQMVTAVSAIANGGVMLLPHVVRQVVGPQESYWPNESVLGRPISQEAAATLTNMLTQALEGESKISLVEGYRLAGKTGTAQIPTENGYDPNWTIASFIGWGPVDDPRFVVYVQIDKPQISPWGSVVAAPVFKEIVDRLVVQLEIPPDTIRDQIAATVLRYD